MLESFLRRTQTVITILIASVCSLLASSFTSFAAGFRITSVQITNSDVRIAWDAPGGSNYVVQAATGLTTLLLRLWTAVAT